MSTSVERFATEMVSKGKNIREIIALGVRKRYKPNDILAVLQRQMAKKSVGKAEVLMDEEELSSDEEPTPKVGSNMEEDLLESTTDMNVAQETEQEDDQEGWDDGDWDEDGGGWDNDDDGPANIEMGPPELTRTLSFKVHEINDVQGKMDSLIGRVSDLLYISKDEAGCLLRHYRWDDGKLKKEWFDDQKKVRITVGLCHRRNNNEASSSDGKVQCSSWGCQRVPTRKAHALACGHYFCKRCWRNFLESEVSKGRTCIFARCPAMRCKRQHVHKFGCACTELVPSSVFQKYLKKPGLLQKYQNWNLQSFVEGQEGLKWCPNPKCNHVVEYKLGGEKTIECQCGTRFCFSCSKLEHEPAPCDLVTKWLNSTAVSDDATELWLKARTKTCPKCNVRIEKNRACNHMHCTKCGHHFCWLCKGPWSKHGTSTGGYYVCKKYDEDAKKGIRSNEEKDMISTQQMLQKYTYYVGRFNDAKNGVHLTKKLEHELDQQFIAQNKSVEQTKFITDATTSLATARTCMQWCYVLDFYLITGKEKKLFEFQQQLLIEQTESLQELIEDNRTRLNVLLMKKKDILSKTTSLNNLRKRMIDLVKEGNFEAVLSYKGDEKSDNW
eukprot:CAMPEP_0167786620 /NCGR_PEP_ID=MMETSP0111_2-20121227/8911_1 /TAXON_ID=91324 /ORGANISM="Lotharella globosa, Strain CCCM811" /LENGTH=609 /DNA_ID=CAMNT_0007678057 /DNA_START=60 /DNA_END=1886 /DNA_ORIENTATION=-